MLVALWNWVVAIVFPFFLQQGALAQLLEVVLWTEQCITFHRLIQCTFCLLNLNEMLCRLLEWCWLHSGTEWFQFHGLLLQQGALTQFLERVLSTEQCITFLQADQMHLLSFASEYNALQVARMVLVALWNWVVAILWPFSFSRVH